ncbi:MAG: class I SAM-dependent methyltransferase [Gammaproteobacteria bacterium]|nr:class I SAM-dependent methyltransferase [Gammaproteobacteria bacterium]
MDRIPEPELMTDPEQARAYAAADFSEPHDHFIELFREHFPGRDISGLVLDLGCGPADISIRFARAYPGCRVLGVDGARAMLDEGMRAVAAAGLADRVQLMEGYLPGAALPEVDYAAVISNSLLHHMRDPADFWQTVAAAAGPGTPVCVMDLMRPAGLAEAETLVATHAADTPAVLRRDFYRSLLAAYRPEEVQDQLLAAGLAHLSAAAISDRHWLVAGLQ